MSEEERALNEETVGEDELRQKGGGRSQGFLWLVVIGIVIYLLVSRVGMGVLVNIIIAALGIGIVIIVHEFGHFSIAKLTGMKVEAFSVGFPPTLLGILRTEAGWRIRILPSLVRKKKGREAEGEKFKENESDENESDKKDAEEGRLTFTIGKPQKPGETEYRAGLIPFGGYVKILGQEDIGKIKSSDDPRAYANKPVWKRMCFIAAGVVFNAVLAVAASIIVFHIGIKLVPPIVGGVKAGSPAERAGLRGGDEVIEIEGRSYNLDFYDVSMAAVLSGRDEKVALRVRHEDGSIEEFKIVPEEMEGPAGKMKLFGIAQPETLTIAKLDKREAQNLFEITGLRPGDIVKAVNGKEVKTRWELDEIISEVFEPAVTLVVERKVATGAGDHDEQVTYKTELVEVKLQVGFNTLKRGDKSESGLGEIYSMVPRLMVEGVSSLLNPDKREAWLQAGDIILAVADVENPTFKQMRAITEQHEGKQLAVKVLRRGANGVEGAVTVNVVPTRFPNGDKVVIGITLRLDLDRPVIARAVKIDDKLQGFDIPDGAMITAVGGVGVSNFYDIVSEMNRYVNKDVSLEWQVDEETKGSFLLKAEDWGNYVTVNPELAEYIPFEPLLKLYKARGPIDAVKMGYKRALWFIRNAYMTLTRFIQGQVSPKNFMGPVGIAKMSYAIVKERQLILYLYVIGFISAFIGVFNALPLLPFDGGHILFLLIEKIKGSPVSERIQLSFVTAGWVLVGMLVVYITINDIMR